jgi:uncharacterized membrane protein
VLLLTLVWGFSWPVMKIGVTELAPLTFRAITLPFSALSMLAFAKLSGDSIRVPRRLWGKVAALALFNISAWNGLVLFGVQQLPSGRSAILAYTMPIWTVLFSLVLLHEPLSKRKLIGMALGMTGMAVLLGDDVRHFERTPQAALFILGAALTWAFGIVLVRKWRAAVAPEHAVRVDDSSGLAAYPRACAATRARPDTFVFGDHLVRDPLQRVSRRSAGAMGVARARAPLAGGRDIDVIASGADRRCVRRDAGTWRTTRAWRMDGVGAGRRGDGRGFLAAKINVIRLPVRE